MGLTQLLSKLQWNERTLLPPEVIQTSGMDCGPSALKAALEGFGVVVNYSLLREICKTSVDGTSVQNLIHSAEAFGLKVEDHIVPDDLVFGGASQYFPAIVVTTLPNLQNHVEVVWGRYGNYLLVMDPARGRYWIDYRKFRKRMLNFSHPVEAKLWREWAGSAENISFLKKSLKTLKISESVLQQVLEEALKSPDWQPLAALHASQRFVSNLTQSGAIAVRDVSPAILRLFESSRSRELKSRENMGIPYNYWPVHPPFDFMGQLEQVDYTELTLKGAVLICILGRETENQTVIDPINSISPIEPIEPINPAVLIDLKEASIREKALKSGQKQKRIVSILLDLKDRFELHEFNIYRVLLFTTLITAVGVALEAVFLRAFLDFIFHFSVPRQKMGGTLFLVLLSLGVLLLDFPKTHILNSLGRKLETRIRAELNYRIPRLSYQYFRSRPTADMAQRSHSLFEIRSILGSILNLIRTLLDFGITLLGILWLDPSLWRWVCLLSVSDILFSAIMGKRLSEYGLKMATFQATQAQFFFDTLKGLIPVRSHAAERSVRNEFNQLRAVWKKSVFEFQNLALNFNLITSMISMLLGALLLYFYMTRTSQPVGSILLFYWISKLPGLGSQVGNAITSISGQRGMLLRLLDIFETPLEDIYQVTHRKEVPNHEGPNRLPMAISIQNITLQSGGITILKNLSLALSAGEHIAIVGESGSGKSSLISTLLGFNEVDSGQIIIDGAHLTPTQLCQMREETAWVDPDIQLWNRSFIENIRYGYSKHSSTSPQRVIEESELHEVLEKMPEGLQTRLGEGGSMVSGGEGQRVRLARAHFLSNARLVLLDEAFRGLPRDQRSRLLENARALWSKATLLFVTHDLSESARFPRVIVIQKGQIIEDGKPQDLLARPDSTYSRMVHAEQDNRGLLWSAGTWRKISLHEGKVVES